MIKLTNLSKSFGNRLLFQEVGFSVHKKEKIGIIGRNGYGKSTLLKMISGEQQPEEGEIIIPKDYRIAELSQHIHFTEETVLSEAKKGLRPEQKDEIWKAEMILSGLGFTEEDFQKSPHEFSGGYQIRINLAKALLCEPDMLLLDEPTNYLDIVSLRWMERFLQKWNGEFLLVTHDRVFMDAVVSHVAIIHRQRIKKQKGKTIDAYRQIRQEEDVYEKTRIGMEKKKAKSEDFIRKFRAGARSAGLVQSRIKMLDKLEPKEKLEKISEIRFSFRSIPIHSGQMMGIHSLKFGYEKSKKPLLDGLDFTIFPGDRIGIVGRNGAGKSTLLKLLNGEIKPDSGTIKEKADLVVGYFGQTNVLSLSPKKTILEELSDTKGSPGETEIRSLCGSLLFSGDDVHKPIEVLSGGEKSRVSLGKLLLSPHHVLLLDEPTNHLDMESTDALCNALEDFDGAIVIISHLHQPEVKKVPVPDPVIGTDKGLDLVVQ
jgi:ATP-binding cassette subfamily F protein 3